ncbi:zinc finger protein 800 isoform X2 [Podarcis raffonei]|uniref:zinc finger protein 800 isoform X2 n=1 Tax=Podarcis raffonei TaxID=65483 RepID=UPI0023291D96|nr:zinc finger protein 800 isoform X2 [Podarcis raffonei]
MPLRDKCCQTDHHHHGCCEPVHILEPGDHPLLQQPLQTSKSGIQQIIECFRSGTKQLKHILLKDVDTIFECKLCRSLFRGLPNLITHKKFYCPPSLRMDDNSPDVNDKQSQAISDLLEAMYPRVDKQEYIIRLEPIETNRNAVFQYVSKADSTVENIEMNVTTEPAPVAETPETTAEPPKSVPSPSQEETAEVAVAAAASKVILTPEEPSLSTKPKLERDKPDLGHQLICCLCKKEFHSRRSVRRHIRKVHKKKMEELKKFIEIKRRPNQTSGRGRNKNILVTLGRSCPVCYKSFATKANVRRHFDEVHRGLRRDSITPDIATKPGEPLSLESAKKSVKTRKQKSLKAEYNLTTCKCLLCKRKYSSQVMLKRHMQIVHKITLSAKNAKREKKPNNAVSTEVKEKTEPAESVESVPPLISSPQNETKGTNHSNERKNASSSTEKKNASSSAERKNASSAERKNASSAERKNASSAERKNASSVERKNASSAERKNASSAERKNASIAERKNASSAERKNASSAERKNASSAERKNASSSTERKNAPPTKKNKVKPSSENSKSSNQSIASGLRKPRKPRLSVGFDFKKLYCKLCKRQFTSKQNLTKHIELHTDGNNIFVKFYRCPLCPYETRRKRDVIRHITVVHKKSSRYLGKITASLEIRAVKKPIDCVLNKVTRRGAPRDESKQIGAKPDVTSNSPSKKYEGADVGIEVKVTKNFSLHRCNKCGKAFAKKTFLEHHKKTHKANASHSPEENNTTKGRSTRSKALVC